MIDERRAILLEEMYGFLRDQIEEIKRNQDDHAANQLLLAKNQQNLVDATNHKIDKITSQFRRQLLLVLIVGAPIVFNNWEDFSKHLIGLF